MSSDDISAFRDSAADFLGAADQRQRKRKLAGTAPGLERAMWSTISELGWLSILVSEEDDGLGLGLPEATAIAEQVGHFLLPEPVVDAGFHPLALLSRLPPGTMRRELLQSLQDGTKIAGVAWQEQAGQLEPRKYNTVATSVDGNFRLQGHKRFVLPGNGADGWLVSANLEGTAAIFWVPSASAGLRIGDSRCVDGGVISEVFFSDCEVPAAHLLAHGAPVDLALCDANDVVRVCQGAELLGIAARALAITQEYVSTRVQFGKPIGSFQALQHRLVDGYIQVELSKAGLREGLAQLSRGETTLAALASRVKARCAHAALQVSRASIQLHGAIGYTDECDIGLYFNRALALAGRLGGIGVHQVRHFREARTLARATPAADHPETSEFPRDADWDAMPEPQFRRMVRAFITAHYPAHLRYLPHRAHWTQIKEWYFTLSRQGWIAPAWPKEHGGMGLPPDKLIAFIEEHEQYGVARPPDQGLIMLGPILIRFGTDDQRARFLPRILSGEHVWCQGYSEPNAGSDLASLRCEAVLDNGHFIVNGQKTWSTLAQDATHMFMLVRSSKEGKKQEGISFLLVDLATPGVTVRPIRNIAGDEEFCEVFFDNVLVPGANLVGELHQGWTIAKALLGFERLFGGSPKHAQYTLGQLEVLARTLGLFEDPAFVARYAQAMLDTADLSAAYAGFADIAKRGENLPQSVSLLKIWATETHERIAMFLTEAAAEYGGMAVAGGHAEVRQDVVAPLYNALAATIFSGTNEIQRNILAKQVLNLPS